MQGAGGRITSLSLSGAAGVPHNKLCILHPCTMAQHPAHPTGGARNWARGLAAQTTRAAAPERLVVLQAQLVHGVQDAAVHRLEAVAHIRQRTAHYHRHCILQQGRRKARQFQSVRAEREAGSAAQRSRARGGADRQVGAFRLQAQLGLDDAMAVAAADPSGLGAGSGRDHASRGGCTTRARVREPHHRSGQLRRAAEGGRGGGSSSGGGGGSASPDGVRVHAGVRRSLLRRFQGVDSASPPA